MITEPGFMTRKLAGSMCRMPLLRNIPILLHTNTELTIRFDTLM